MSYFPLPARKYILPILLRRSRLRGEAEYSTAMAGNISYRARSVDNPSGNNVSRRSHFRPVMFYFRGYPGDFRGLVSNLRADDIAGNDEFDPPVLLAARRGTIVGHWHRLAKPLGRQIGGREPLFHQVGANGRSTLLRQRLVELIAAGAVGMSFDVDV